MRPQNPPARVRELVSADHDLPDNVSVNAEVSP
jgi:hypothetical protein